MSKLESQPDHEFENTILKVENAALQLELKESIAAQKAATEQIGKLAPVAATAAKLASENKMLRDAATANAKAIADAGEAVKQWGLWAGKHKTLSDQYKILDEDNADKSRAVTRWSEEADKQEKIVTERDGEIRDLKQAAEVQKTKIRVFQVSFFATAALILVTVTAGLWMEKQLTIPAGDLSAEAGAAWQQHLTEYRAVFQKAYGQALQKEGEKASALQQENQKLKAELSPFGREVNENWRFWDWLCAIGLAAVVGLIAFIVGVITCFIFR
jgi:hypothetical protein